MTTSNLVAGVDGGGTRTRIALADTQGNLRALVHCGPANIEAYPIDTVRGNLRSGFSEALSLVKGTPRLKAVFLGLAGVVSDTDQKVVRDIARSVCRLPSGRVGVDHDIRTALAGGLAGRDGIALISGTGSSSYGRRKDGRSWMGGGWGHLLDDVGSGYWLSVEAMRSAMKDFDGRGRATTLTKIVRKFLRIDNMIDAMRRVYADSGDGRPMSKDQIAALAPQVLAEARRGDAEALRIVREGAEGLAAMARAVDRKLKFPGKPVPMILVGSVVRKNPIVVRFMRRKLDGIEIVEPLLPPIGGAVLLALEMIGVVPGKAAVGALARALEGKA